MKPSIIYLASASPRRAEILTQLGIPHQVLRVPPPEGEDEPQFPGEWPESYVRRTAREKAIRASQWLAGSDISPDRPITVRPEAILAADTTVILSGRILGKPADGVAASRMLEQLSGRAHHVHTAVALVFQGRMLEAVSVTAVHFRTLKEEEIALYCQTGEPLGKAGAYGIQGRAAAFIRHISGSYTGVMGLPAFETCALLNTLALET